MTQQTPQTPPASDLHPVARVLTLCIGRLSDVTWKEADDLLEAEEAETALSLVCSELLDSDVSITQEIYDAIGEAGRHLDLGTGPASGLEGLIRD